jgi:hypothetical protein
MLPGKNFQLGMELNEQREARMKRHFFSHYGIFTAAVALAVSLLVTGPAEAQNYAAGSPSVSTPRMPDGKPDLNGMWNGNLARGFGGAAKCDPKDKGCFEITPGTFPTRVEENGVSSRVSSRRCDPTQKGPDGISCYENTNQNADGEFTNANRRDPNRPLYKPEYWDKVQDLDYNTNTKDPLFTCMPLGVPRMGPPLQILQTAKYVVFFYSGESSVSNQFRIIPIDGRAHDPVRAKDISYFGDAIGHWEGDTLVVEAVGFNDETWLGTGGLFHSYDMRLTERLTRDGNTMQYQSTVDDPTVLLQPWVMNPRDLQLNSDSQAYLQENDQCSQPDPGWVVNKIRH